jgi:hypothetical protein
MMDSFMWHHETLNPVILCKHQTTGSEEIDILTLVVRSPQTFMITDRQLNKYTQSSRQIPSNQSLLHHCVMAGLIGFIFHGYQESSKT